MLNYAAKNDKEAWLWKLQNIVKKLKNVCWLIFTFFIDVTVRAEMSNSAIESVVKSKITF